MKKIFGKRDLAFWLGVMLFICVLPINYPMSKVEAQSIWVDPPAEGITDGPHNVTSNETVSSNSKSIDVIISSGIYLDVNENFWVLDDIENHGNLNFYGGTTYVKNGVTSDGDIIVRNGANIYSDINSSGSFTSYEGGTIYGDISQQGNAPIDITGGILNGNIVAESGNVNIDGAIINGNISTNSGLIKIKNSVVTGNISSNSGDVEISDESSVTGNISNDSGDINIYKNSIVTGDVTNRSLSNLYIENATINGNVRGRNIYVNDQGIINGKLTFAYNNAGEYIRLYGKADYVETNIIGDAESVRLYSGYYNTIEIKPIGDSPVINMSDSEIYLDEGVTLINNSGITLYVTAWYWDDDNEYPAMIPVGNNQTFSYNNDLFNNLCKVNKNLGDLPVKDGSYGTFTISNPLPTDLTYHITKDSLYPFVLDASVQKGYNSEQYMNKDEKREDYSNRDVYSFVIPANSSKTIKVSVADDYTDFGEKTISTGDILQFVKVEGFFDDPMFLQLEHSEGVASIKLSANITKSEPPKEEKEPEKTEKTEKTVKTGSGNISVNDVYFGKTPKVDITSNTNDVSKAKILFTGTNYSSATAPKNPGTYKVTATLPGNDDYKELVLTSEFKISFLPTPENPFALKGNKGERNYYTEKVVISAPEGYSISISADGPFTNSIEITESSTLGRIYLQNADGEITDGIAIDALLLDLNNPSVKNNSEGSSSETAKIEVSDDNLYKIFVDSKEYSFTGKSAVIELKLEDGNGNQTFEIKAVDESGRETVYTVELVSEWFKTGIIPKGGKLKIKKGQKFTLGDGVTGVEGDSTVYSSGVKFYTADEGEYIFK